MGEAEKGGRQRRQGERVRRGEVQREMREGGNVKRKEEREGGVSAGRKMQSGVLLSLPPPSI